MAHSPQVQASASAVRKLWEKHGVKAPFRFLGFCLSLLPIPVISTVGQALDRHLSDRALEQELEAIWDRINAIDPAPSKAGDLEDGIAAVANAAARNPELGADVRRVMAQLGLVQEEFVVLSEEGSYQEVVQSLITAETAAFVAKSGSTNAIENTTVNANSTLLHASGGSKNYVNATRFQGVAGSVGMQGITTSGDVRVSDSSLGFGVGGMVTFGGNPFEVSAACPACGANIKADRRKLVGYHSIQCPNCLRAFRFQL